MKNITVDSLNQIVLEKLSAFLNDYSDVIEKTMVEELVMNYQLPLLQAYGLLLAGVLEMEVEENPIDQAIFRRYFPKMIQKMDEEEYKKNPYYQNIQLPEKEKGSWAFIKKQYKAYEAFVFDDFIYEENGMVIPQIGFFDRGFTYPAVLENQREWMTITPNEVNTMKKPIANAKGKVCTYGLGLGYYPYMISLKKEVTSIIIVEKNKEIISLFKEYILPQFPDKEKITLIEDDAFNYAQTQMGKENFDVVFTDLWHDPLDGREMYIKMKSFEKNSPHSHFDYWIEKTLQYYL